MFWLYHHVFSLLNRLRKNKTRTHARGRDVKRKIVFNTLDRPVLIECANIELIECV